MKKTKDLNIYFKLTCLIVIFILYLHLLIKKNKHMKKLLLGLVVLSCLITSCEKEEINHGCGPDEIWVEAYTQSDGTHVSGYCRAAHNN